MIKLEDIQAQQMLSSVVPEQIVQAANWVDPCKQLAIKTLMTRAVSGAESVAAK